MSYWQDESLDELGMKVIKSHPEFQGLDGCRISYLYCDEAKRTNGKTVFADTTKVSDKIKAIANVDFIITFYERNCYGLEKPKMELLMYHELRHIGYFPTQQRYTIIPHDLQDFKSIVRKYGVDWITD